MRREIVKTLNKDFWGVKRVFIALRVKSLVMFLISQARPMHRVPRPVGKDPKSQRVHTDQEYQENTPRLRLHYLQASSKMK